MNIFACTCHVYELNSSLGFFLKICVLHSTLLGHSQRGRGTLPAEFAIQGGGGLDERTRQEEYIACDSFMT